MTTEDRSLDPNTLIVQSLALYRLTRKDYASLSGLGSARRPGRWNRPGEEAIYTSTEIGVPVLERLAHTSKDLIPANLALMTIRLSANWMRSREGLIDRDTTARILIFESLALAKSAFAATQKSFSSGMNVLAIAVPSVIVPVWNVVLYPQAPHFWQHVSLESIEPFQFDPRLFPEGAPTEPAI